MLITNEHLPIRQFLLICLLIIPTILTLSSVAIAVDARPYAVTEKREPCTDYNNNKKPFFGDTHVHTAYSFDASAQDTRNTPRDAYRFAKGAAMGIQPYNDDDQPQRTIQLDRPLDFTVVTDHSEFLGEINICMTPGSDGYWHPICIAHRVMPQYSMYTFAAYGFHMKSRWGFCGDENENCLATAEVMWNEIQAAAEESYDRSADCSFTSFVGYEWTASVGGGDNLHRNVVFQNKHVPKRPIGWIDSPSVDYLWDFLQTECVDGSELEAGETCNALTIPHNSNLSNGVMFKSAKTSIETIPDHALTAKEAAKRARWEPLVEIMQHKGSSECDNRKGWVEDEFCGFEKLPYDSFGGKNTGQFESGANHWVGKLMGQETPAAETPEPNNYVRWALKKGLQHQQELGVNPFKYGIIASTDTHIAAPGLTAEKNHPGHGGAGMGAREGIEGLPDELEFGPGGLAVLWAEENSRDSLFAAMQRGEAYATSGTRPIVRMFGGSNYANDLCSDPEMIEKGYAGGVPMGGTLTPSDLSSDKSSFNRPQFVVSALQDSGSSKISGTPLQRIQIIKGWYANGELQEKVLDIAGGANSASVDLNSCEQSGAGHKSLCTVWEDSEFDPSAPAFYYTRVLENPSCRWSQYICLDAQVDCTDPDSVPEGLKNCCASDHQPIIQERAWTSPIWYTP